MYKAWTGATKNLIETKATVIIKLMMLYEAVIANYAIDSIVYF